MAKVKLYRRPGTGTMCLVFANGNGNSARHSLPLKLTEREWDGEHVTASHPRRRELDLYLSGILTRARIELLRIHETEPTRNVPASDLKDRVVAVLFPDDEQKPASFTAIYTAFANSHTNPRTRELYRITYERIREFDPRELTFDDVTLDWIERFEAHLKKRSPSANARAIHLRNIRAAFNYAIKHDKTTLYPFRKKSIERSETLHRDLTAAEIRRLFAYVPPTQHKNKHASQPLDYAIKWLDMARLSFYLIGINVVDLWHLTPSDVYGGRLHYRRAKTGTLYDVKIQPEAAAILEKYRGEQKLISLCETQNDYKDFAKAFNRALGVISTEQNLPRVTTYWLRHSWATIAYLEAHIPVDTISDCLGHKRGHRVTLGYIDKLRDVSTCDAANRAVLDLIN